MEQPAKLLNRNYLLQWQGQSISRLGSQAFAVAMLFWIKHATGSAALMGLLQMLSTLPAVLLTPIGGAVADRYSRRKIIIFSDLLRGIAVLSLAGLMSMAPDATQVTLVWLFVVSILITVITTFFGPAISATIPDLVPKDKVAAANSLGQLSFQLSVFIGQGLGGMLFRLLGAPLLFLINGVSYLYASASQTFVVIPQVIPERSSGWKEQFLEFRMDILEGLRYVWHREGLRETVFVSAFLGFFTAPIIILLPFYVEDVLQAKVDWYGFILAVSGLGALLGYLFVGAIRLSGKARGRVMMAFIILQAAGYGVLGLVRNPTMAVALAFLGGFTSGFVTVNITTIVQITTPGEIRGRVFGLLAAISGSLTPIAMGLAGVVADLVNQNIPLIYVSCGAIMTLLSVLVSLSRDFHGFLAHDQKGEIPHGVKEQVVALD
ncbi:MAG: MFS transporter [Chloroflexota bacterium]|nr:MFS transporter [Chloroflexota bacterium]